MATLPTKSLLKNAVVFFAPVAIVLAILVGLGELATGPAILAGLALFSLIAILLARPLGRLRRLQNRIEKINTGDIIPESANAVDVLTDPGGGAIGDLALAFQRMERLWLDRQSRLVYASAAARAVMRRTRPAFDKDMLTYADIVMDLGSHRVSRGDKTIDLGPTEFRLLRFLLEHPGRVFNREQLLDRVWDQDAYIEPRTVDVHIRRLRKAMNLPGTADLIRTVRSAGYALELDPAG